MKRHKPTRAEVKAALELYKPLESGKMSERHLCHWPKCTTPVPPAMWGCKKHWFMLPKFLRDAIWETYVPGQEITKTPSLDYLLAATHVQIWIKENYGDLPR